MSFERRSIANTNRMASTGSMMGSVAGYVNPHIAERKGLTRHQTQLVAESRLFSMFRCAIEIPPKTTIKK
jgi:hypothetical protein